MSLDKKDLLLYAVTNRSWLAGNNLYSQVEKAIRGGVTFVQLREKELQQQTSLKRQKRLKNCVTKTKFL